MTCADFVAWVLGWRGVGARFEIVPVVASAETRKVVEPHLQDADVEAD